MNTLQARVKQLLEQTGLPVSYSYPAAWSRFPCLSWYESGNRVYAQADAREHLTELTYVVDAWADAPEALAVAGLAVDECLAEAGFRRTFAQDLYENRTRLHHRTMRYRAVVDGAGNIYQ